MRVSCWLGLRLDNQYAFVCDKNIQYGDGPRVRRRDGPRDRPRDRLRVRPLKIFARVEEVAGVEGAFDLGVEITEGRGGGCFPPRFFGEAYAVFTTDDAAHF